MIGVSIRRNGEDVMGWVKPRDATLTASDLVAAYCDRIASYKIPRRWQIVDAFLMTVTGKVQKYRLRKLALGELDLRAAA